jgi:hypothetical protein
MACSGLVNHSNLNHTYGSLTAILTSRDNDVLVEFQISGWQKLLTFVDSTINDQM